MQIHMALYKWKNTAGAETISRLLRDVEGLVNQIPNISSITATKNDSKYSKGYTHVIFVMAETQAAIDCYRSHPEHTKIAHQIEAIELHGIGVDFTVG